MLRKGAGDPNRHEQGGPNRDRDREGRERDKDKDKDSLKGNGHNGRPRVYEKVKPHTSRRYVQCVSTVRMYSAHGQCLRTVRT